MSAPGALDPTALALLHGAGAGLCVAGPDGRITAVNDEWLRVAGVARADAEGREVCALVGGGAHELCLRAHAGERVPLPRHRRGALWCEGLLAPVDLPGGRGVVVTLRDVTPEAERAAARERAARDEAAALLQAISDTSSDVIYAKDRDGRIRFANPATLQLIGKPLDEVLGRTDLELLEDEEVARRIMENDRRIMASEASQELEELVPTPDGSPRVWLSRKAPYRGPDGAVAGLLGISRDVTDRTRARAALEESESRLTALVRSAPAFMAVLRGPRHVFELANEKYFEVIGRREIVGKPVVEAIPEVADTDYPGLLDRVYREGVPVARTGDMLRLGSPGAMEEHWIDFVYLPLRDPDGAVSGIFVHGVDVTQHKRDEEALRDANARLAESDRRKTEFLAVLSHELRNPLAPIMHAVAILERAPPASAAADRARDVLKRQASHLTRLVDDLLDVTRIARGKVELQRARLDLVALVRQTCDDHLPAFARAGVRLAVAADPDALWVDADATRLAQVLGNLLHNAAKFTPRGGSVTVSVGAAGPRAEVRVADDGPGIPAADLQRVFDPFAQAEQGLARSAGGLGLGLALVRGLVELHGGTVAATAGRPRGAELVVALPRAEAPAPAPPPRLRAGGVARRVLVVEDNGDAARSLADLLELSGHEVAVAGDGAEGLALARTARFDAVLCDLGLPGLDGYAVARALRGDAATRDLLLVAVSGYAQAEDRERARAAGFDAHLAKPPRLDDLERLLADGAPARAAEGR